MSTPTDDAHEDIDHDHVRRAIELAERAVADGNTPFGSLLVRDGQVIAEDWNTTQTDDDMTAHPELKLARWAARELDDASDVTMYTSTEPCPMCAGGMYQAGLRRVVFSTSAEQLATARGSTEGLIMPCSEVFARGSDPVEVVGPVLAEECLTLHESFW